MSGILNNIPVVVIFIPLMQVLAERLNHAPSHLMMPLSFAAILGGMTTLIGSSTNLLVSGTLIELGHAGFNFFQFTLPGIALALIGLVYLVFAAPWLLPDRAPLTAELGGGTGRQFIAQITVAAGSRVDAISPRGGFFPELKEVTIRVIQRDEHAFLPPFDNDLVLAPGDVIVIAATRKALTDVVGGETDLLHPEIGADPLDEPADDDVPRPWQSGDQALAEAMVPPGSRLIGQTLEQIGFRYQYHCIVLGIQRQSRMIRTRVTEIRLAAGDVLLLQGGRDDIRALRGTHDVLLIEWSATDLPSVHHARSAVGIFALVVIAAASGVVPIVVAALCGAGLMLATGVLTIGQAARAIDRTVVMTIAAALALGAALQQTGGANFLADILLAIVGAASPWIVLSAFFLLVALLSNIITTKATAVLFTPIAVGVADRLGVPIEAFVVAVVFAANCSFASPIGYQTNLLVMAPGHYRFADFSRAGVPLLVIIWLAFTAIAPLFYEL